MALTPQGFVANTADEIVTDLNGKVLANVGAGLDLSPDQPMGQIIGIMAQKFSDLQQLGATVYNALNPAAAEGPLLANVAAISGTVPQVATLGTVTLSVTLDAGATLNAGAIAAVAGQPTNTWVTTLSVTNTSFSSGAFNVPANSTTPGPLVANAHTITTIVTPSIGWTLVDNPAAAVAGLPADTDTALRQRRQLELTGEGSGDIDAIRSAVLAVPGVIQAFCFENTELGPDSTGIPGKAFRVVVWDNSPPAAADTALAQAIWSRKPSGILASGATQVQVADSQGGAHSIGFNRAATIRLYVSCTTTPAVLTTAQTLVVKQALANYALQAFGLGVNVIDLPFRASAIVPGITSDVPIFLFGTTASPTNTANLTITSLQIATLATGDILVNGI